MGLKTKLQYGFNALKREVLGWEDYWHLRTPAVKHDIKNPRNLSYYLDFSKKGNYPFTFINGIPVVKIDSRDTIFPITIFNYGLGLCDSLLNDNKVIKEKLDLILAWAINNQDRDGYWRANHESRFWKLQSGWTSAMTQGLGISFLIRCHRMQIGDDKAILHKILKAKEAMFSSQLVNMTSSGPLLQEFEGSNADILNGFIFAIFGLYDYSLHTGDYKDFYRSIKVLKETLGDYNFFSWSYYSRTKFISSVYYHQLHIDQMLALYYITNDEIFMKYHKKWKAGLVFKYFFIIFKTMQKVFHYNSIATLDVE